MQEQILRKERILAQYNEYTSDCLMIQTILGTEYMVRWKSTWLSKGELANVWRLLWEFEAKSRARHGRKPGRPARTDRIFGIDYTLFYGIHIVIGG